MEREARADELIHGHVAGAVAAAAIPVPVVDLIAVADVQLRLSAEAPDRVLNEAGEEGWKCPVVGACVDLASQALNEGCASSRGVAGRSEGMVGFQPPQDPGSVEEVMNEAVDRNHARACRHPSLARRVTRKQEVGERHRKQFV